MSEPVGRHPIESVIWAKLEEKPIITADDIVPLLPERVYRTAITNAFRAMEKRGEIIRTKEGKKILVRRKIDD